MAIMGAVNNVLKVERPFYEQEQLNNELNYSKPSEQKGQYMRSKLNNFRPRKCLANLFPVFTWMSQYSFKRDIIGDLISGCTVAVMHIPQGMGYALLANVPAVVGIYTAFFPVLFYFIFGTSRHNSMGTFAVVSIMVGKSVMTYSNYATATISTNFTESLDSSGVLAMKIESVTSQYSPIEVATTLCFMVGIIQLIMFTFRLGIISSLLSETLVSGFTTGAAIHVLTSQVKDLLGIKLPSIAGHFKLIFTYEEIFKQIFSGNINWSALIITVITCTILVINNDFLKPKLAKKCSVPIPIELIAVVSGTICSKLLQLEESYGVKPIGHIPTGFPVPQVPRFDLLNELAIDAFTIAMVSYTVSVSMALIFAQKLNYEIDFNQELFAMGGGNILGSFFSCIPFSASLSRSTIQQAVGGRTQLASVISCSILTVVLLCIGPFFEPLPRCVLASVIVVALKGMIMQTKEFFKFWRMSRLDASVWLVTFLTVCVFDIDIGLAVGIVLSLTCIFIRGMKPYTCLLGNVPNTDLYLDINRYKAAEEINSIKIFHYCGSLNFASRSSFKTELCSLIGINLAKETRKFIDSSDSSKDKKYEPIYLKSLIIDFSALSYIDPSGVTCLKTLIREFYQLSIYVFIAGCSCPDYEMMKKCDLKESTDGYFKFFPTVHDAVHHANDAMAPIVSVISEVV